MLGAVAGLAAALTGCAPAAPQFDLLVRGGQVLDGRGTPARRADIGVNGDRIVALGDLAAATAATVIDASGRVVSPGFIDVQGQSGTTLLIDGRGESHLRQGITSEIIGEGDSPAFWTAKTASGEALARAGTARRLDQLRPVLPAPDRRRHRHQPRHAGAGDAGAQRGHRPGQPRADGRRARPA